MKSTSWFTLLAFLLFLYWFGMYKDKKEEYTEAYGVGSEYNLRE